MSAVVCGKRASSIFEELSNGSGSPPAAKRARFFGSASGPLPAWPRAAADPALVADLSARFPAMSIQFIEKALEESGNDLDSAIKSLLNLQLDPVENIGDHACERPNQIINEVQASVQGLSDGDRVTAPSECAPSSANLMSDGSGWVEYFTNQMATAGNIDEARVRAARALEAFQKDVIARSNAQAPHEIQKENIALKVQLESLIKENTILRKLFTKQHERQKDYDEKNQELQQMKQHIAQYQERIRTLEVNNYALSMHLRQAQQSSSIPGRHHPDVY
ncbi:uncharacterized protein LOC100825830 [Brachypodium distachyon]|uniref:CUE domain-containing protein n=1 Tax=Brachypodium distachyon TaxID=15368 RepID=I1I2S3_BRADI|nr:uncharacterized protein LOC100825830 [Brachypodium distachyon]KQJ96026.1 hypothetical protein BRADI_3g20490v3 [Brachypodium distachyon]|eukprot:XP_003571630.1 uncharacterized protein LOC100825830 [Brachypodium distachyon]